MAAIRLATLAGFLALYLWPRYFFLSVAGKGVSGFTLAAVALLLLSLYLVLVQRRYAQAVTAAIRYRPAILVAFGLYLAWRLASDLIGESPSTSLGVLALHAVYLGSWLPIGMILCSDARTRNSVPYVIAVAAVVCTVLGIMEARTGTAIGELLGFSSFQAGNAYDLQNIGSTLSRGESVRIRSLFSHPLVYGQMMAAMLPVAAHFALQARGAQRLIGVVVGLCVIYSIVLSNSRSPWIVAAVASVVYFLLFFFDLRRRSRLIALLASFLVVLATAPIAVAALTELSSGRTAEEASSNSSRSRQLTLGTAALDNHGWLTGYGDGTAPAYAGIVGLGGRVTVDNWYLTTAVETGMIGLVLFTLSMITIVLSGLRTTAQIDDGWNRSAAALFTGTVAGLAVGLTILSIEDTISIIYFMAGCLLAMTRDQVATSSALARRSRDAGTAALFGAVRQNARQ